MESYIDKLINDLCNIQSKLSQLLNGLKINVFRNDPDSGVFIIAHPYSFDKNIDDKKKKEQIELKKDFKQWEEHFRLLLIDLPDDITKEIEESINLITQFIELNSDWGTEATIIKNIEKINTHFSSIEKFLHLLEENPEIIIVPDTNSLIFSPDLEIYKSIAGDNITILLIPTVLAELDKLKITHRDESFRKKVESIILRIKGYRNQGSLFDGVTVYKTIKVKAIANEPDFSKTLNWLDSSNNDDRIIATILEYLRKFPSKMLILVTSDINLQNKLELAKLPFVEPPKI